MNPGDTTRPVASITSTASLGALPTATILPSLIPMSPARLGAPVPSISVPLTIFRSYTSSLPNAGRSRRCPNSSGKETRIGTAQQVNDNVLQGWKGSRFELENAHGVAHQDLVAILWAAAFQSLSRYSA